MAMHPQIQAIIESIEIFDDRIMLLREIPTQTANGRIELPQTFNNSPTMVGMYRYWVLKKGQGPMCDRVDIGDEVMIGVGHAHQIAPNLEIYIFDGSLIIGRRRGEQESMFDLATIAQRSITDEPLQ